MAISEKRHADPLDKHCVVSSLRLPSSCCFVTQENGKRLKITAPMTIVEGADSEHLDTVGSIPRHRIRVLLCSQPDAVLVSALHSRPHHANESLPYKPRDALQQDTRNSFSERARQLLANPGILHQFADFGSYEEERCKSLHIPAQEPGERSHRETEHRPAVTSSLRCSRAIQPNSSLRY